MSLAGESTQPLSRRTSRVNDDGTVTNPRYHHIPPMPEASSPLGAQPSRRVSSSPSHSPTAAASPSRAQPRRPTRPQEERGGGVGRGRGLTLRSGLGAVGTAPAGAVTGMKALQPRRTASPAPALSSPAQGPSSASRSPPMCTCEVGAESFLRGVDVLNRVFASTSNPSGVAVPQTSFWRGEAAAEAGNGPVSSTAVTGSRHQMELVRAPLRPVTLVTDGESLVLVDVNGSSHHHNHISLHTSLPRRSTRSAEADGAGTPCVAWWTLEAFTGESYTDTSRSSSSTAVLRALDCVSAPVASAVAWVTSAHPETCHGQAALAALSTPYNRPAQALVVLLRDAATVREALHDICHCYLPRVLQSTYADGVQLRGVWVAPEAAVARLPHLAREDAVVQGLKPVFAFPTPLWAPGLARGTVASTGANEPTDDTRVLHALYPSLQKARMQTAAAAELGHVALPGALRDALVYGADTVHDSAGVVRPQPHTPPRLSTDAARLAAPRRVLSPNKKGRAEDAQTRANAAGAGAGHALGGAVTGISRLLLGTTREASPGTDAEPAVPQTALTPLSGPPSPPWGMRGDGLYCGTLSPTGRRHALSTTAGGPTGAEMPVCCRSVLVYTPRGRVELVCAEVAENGDVEADAARVVTVHDVKEGFARSALGRSLRLRRDQYALVYAPGLPALADTDVVTATHAVLRLVRLNEA